MVGDAGGKAPQWQPIVGGDHVARMLAAIGPPFLKVGGSIEPREMNYQSGAIFRDRDKCIVNTVVLDILGGRIPTIRAVINPDKLDHMGPVAGAWAIIREAN